MTSDTYMRVAPQMSDLRAIFIENEGFAPFEALFKEQLAARLADIEMGRCSEATGISLIGASGAGKTSAINKLIQYTNGWLKDIGSGDMTLVSFRVPSPATAKYVGQTLLRALGYQISSERQAWYIWDLVRHHLKERKVLFVHIDEAQDLATHGTKKELIAISSMLKTLLNDGDWPVGILMSGTPELKPILESDFQIVRRMRHRELPPLSRVSDAEDAIFLIETYCAKAGLECSEEVAEIELAERLIHSAANQFGLVIQVILGTIEKAILEDAKVLEQRHFARAYGDRTGSDDAFNPFVIPDYTRIDPRRINPPEVRP